jgi:predicted transcriptional regulator
MIEEGCSQRRIAKELNLSKTTVNEIVKRYRREVAETGSFIP